MILVPGQAGLSAADPTLLRIRLLGRMEALTLMGETVLPVGGKTRGLLAILAMADRQPVPRSRLAELLWSRRPEDLARASLRQEIHRLLDVFSPLGVDVIDVQRHALALKPALSSVDVERLLSGGLSALDDLELPMEPLLPELNGVDPALDVWLDEQRARVSRHVESVLFSALSDQRDPASRASIASRLLLIDPYNEVAWRAQIEAAVAGGHDAQANRLAEEALRLFTERLGRPPGATTTRLIESVRQRQSQPHEAPVVASEQAEVIHALGSLITMPVQIPDDEMIPLAEAIEDITGDLLAGRDFTLVAPPTQGKEPTAQDVAAYARQLGVDFALVCILRRVGPLDRPSGATRLVVRVIDIRRETPAIIWARSTDLPDGADQSTDGLRRLLVVMIESLYWELLLYEARRLAYRSVRELSTGALAMRAIVLLLRGDGRLLPDIDEALELAQGLDPFHPLLSLATALIETARVTLFMQNMYEEAMSRAAEAVRVFNARHVESGWALMLMAWHVMRGAGDLDKARLLVDELKQRQERGRDPVMVPQFLIEAMFSLNTGDMAEVHRNLDLYLVRRIEAPLALLSDPTAVMLLYFSGRQEDARRLGGVLSTLYPHNVMLIIYTTLVAVAAQDEEQIDMARKQLHARAPGLTISRVLRAHTYLPDVERANLAKALRQIGLPDREGAAAPAAV